jgi:hypothetical protein
MPASDSIRESDSSVSEPDAADPTTRRSHHRGLRRLIAALIFLLVVLLMAFVPPLLNLNRFQRRIERNIAAALGRPVHFDRVSLTLLPLPGFTLDNFVVAEDPAFGAEPIITAASVDATVRFSSLWRRRVEFSTIALTEPTSINLVHTADGRWNIQGLLLQASQIQAAPTAQKYAGPAPRFPYISGSSASRPTPSAPTPPPPTPAPSVSKAAWAASAAPPPRSTSSPSTSAASGATSNWAASAICCSVATPTCAANSPSQATWWAPSATAPSPSTSS